MLISLTTLLATLPSIFRSRAALELENLALVKPETVVAWHRAGFRLFWTWKVRRGQPGRPVISRD